MFNKFEKEWQRAIPSIKSAGERPWGTEDLLAVSSGNMIMKKLFIRAGSKGGLQYHRKRVEAGYIVSGKMYVRLGIDGIIQERVLGAGDHYIFNAGVIHQEEAIEDTIIIECSNAWMNDRVRVEAAFGITDESGLPSTEPGDEVKL